MSIVQTDVEYFLWTDAQKHHEWASSKFWEHKLQKTFPATEGWIVSSQQPPTREKSDRRRVEATVECLYDGSLEKLQIVECKEHNATKSRIQEVEAQVYEACLKYLKGSQRSEMYAMTTVGTLARLWIAYKSEDYLEPFFPKGMGLAEIREYVEANSSDGHYIVEGWEHMKVNNLLPPPRDQILKSQPSVQLADRTRTDTSAPGAASYAEADVHSYVPEDAEWIDVELEICDDGTRVYHFITDKARGEIGENDWQRVYNKHEGQDVPCYLYTGKTTKKHYWVWSIADGDCKIYKGKGKGKGR
jgi:hypothetical protein